LADLGEKWQPQALVAYLRAPTNHFRFTRMPDFHLTSEEAAELAAFLLEGEATEFATVTASGRHAESHQPHPDPQRGKDLVSSLGCLSCHALNEVEDRSTAPTLAQLASSNWERGCLAEGITGRGKAPIFAFNAQQRAALRAFARKGFPAALQRDTPDEFVDRQFVGLRCFACHARDGQPDLLTELAAAKPGTLSTNPDDQSGNRTVHIGRPTLTFTGEKLYSGWIKRFLEGTLPYKPRPVLQGRMPAFPAYAAGLAEGLARQHGYPAESAPDHAVDASLVEIGRRLTGVAGGFSCITCHNVGSQKALAGKDTATVNFACVAERLRPEYYWRYVQDPPHLVPGTMMPRFIGEDGTTSIKTLYNGDPKQQFTAIWHYLMSLRESPWK
jgi:cytochrome c2